jgi:biopolymer transport protein ExbD
MSREKTLQVIVDSSASAQPSAEVKPLDDKPLVQVDPPRGCPGVSPKVTTQAGPEVAIEAKAGRPKYAEYLFDGAFFDGALFVVALVAAVMVQVTATSPLAAVHLVQAGPMVSGETIAVRVDSDNGLSFDDQPLADVVALKRYIAQRRTERGGDAQVVVTADREALFRVVAQALAAARESGAATCRLTVGTVSGKGG